jgi:hypothetical protein
MSELFKYAKPKHASDALNEGLLRIGTLAGYRGPEMDAARRDDAEGAQQFVMPGPVYGDARSAQEKEYLERFMRVRMTGGKIENLNPGSPAVMHEVPTEDALIYCLSNRRSDALKNKFGGSGFVITSSGGFFDAIGRELASRGLIRGSGAEIAECIYSKQQEHFSKARDSRPPTWLLKPLRYSDEFEVRAKWAPREPIMCPPSVQSAHYKWPQLEHVMLHVPAIKAYIKPL